MCLHISFLGGFMEKVIVGKIVNTHGIRGELKVKSSTDFVEERFKKGTHLWIAFENQMIDMVVKKYRFHKGYILVTFEEHENINFVEKYKGCLLYADKNTDLLDEDEYYISDLIGCKVYQDDKVLGTVTEVQLYDHHDILVVDGDRKIMIPYVDAFVQDVDIDEKRIDVTLIEGF